MKKAGRKPHVQQDTDVKSTLGLEKDQMRQHQGMKRSPCSSGLKGRFLRVWMDNASSKALTGGLGPSPGRGLLAGATEPTSLELWSWKAGFKGNLPSGGAGKMVSDSDNGFLLCPNVTGNVTTLVPASDSLPSDQSRVTH